MLTVLVFGSWVLLLPWLPPSSRSLRLFPWASILLHGPLDICLDLLPAAPLPPVQKPDAQHMFLQHRGAHAEFRVWVVRVARVRIRGKIWPRKILGVVDNNFVWEPAHPCDHTPPNKIQTASKPQNTPPKYPKSPSKTEMQKKYIHRDTRQSPKFVYFSYTPPPPREDITKIIRPEKCCVIFGGGCGKIA